MPIMFNMVLKARGIDPAAVRLVRHHDTRPECKISPYGLWRRDPALLEHYQSIQSNEVFKVGNTLACFVRTPGGPDAVCRPLPRRWEGRVRRERRRSLIQRRMPWHH